MVTLSRRRLIRSAIPFSIAFGFNTIEAQAQNGLQLGPGVPYGFAGLVQRARVLAGQPYVPPAKPAPEIVEQIDYDRHNAVRFRPELAPWANGPGRYPVMFFHIGRLFAHPVKLHLVENDRAREVVFSRRYFDIPAGNPALRLPEDVGFAGFRLQEARQRDDWQTQDWLAFLGASYFRAIGASSQYGLSARAVAIGTGGPGPEEFPIFTEFFVHPATGPEAPAVVDALLDGPSLAGAFRFIARRGIGVVVDTEAHLFMRADIDRLGLAPLTSMFWYGEQHAGSRLDWRPEVHDSDGLALWTGAGERIWRPLNNPPRPVISSFLDDAPKGFGLMQRDREFEHYLDGVGYDRRPSVWVEPVGNWGKGAVQLVELPTNDEFQDNIVAMWVPGGPVRAGSEHAYRYQLYWQNDEPEPPREIARVVATRLGQGAEPGRFRTAGVFRFVIELAGHALDMLPAGTVPQAVVTAERGEVLDIGVQPIPTTRRWRIIFDYRPVNPEPVDLRAFLALADRPLSETWLYQLHPNV